MEQNKNSSMPQKKTEMPERQGQDISRTAGTTARPEIDLPLKGGRSDADLSSTKKPVREDSERSSR
jgi:hypothetical protein